VREVFVVVVKRRILALSGPKILWVIQNWSI
jgi:hypothetical protein